MCTVVSDNCSCSPARSSGVSAEAVLATFVVLGGIAVVGAVFKVALVPIGVVILACWMFRARWLRRAVFAVCVVLSAGVLWLARWALARLTKPSREVVRPREYEAVLYLAGPAGRRRVLRSGPVPGHWASADDVERELVDRWEARYGPPAGGALVCQAKPRR